MQLYTIPAGVGAINIAPLLKLTGFRGAGLFEVGCAFFPCGAEHPVEGGYSTHEQHEVSLILSGALEIETQAGVREVSAGQVVHIEPHEAHRVRARSDSAVYYVLFGVQ